MSAPTATGTGTRARRARPLIAGIGLLMLAGTSQGQARLDTQALVRETQKMAEKRNDANAQEMTLVWWIPVEFWEDSLRKNPEVPKHLAAKLRSTLEPYTMVIVMNVQVGPFGGLTFKSADEVRASVTLRDAHDTSYAPLDDAQISPDAKSLISIMKPMLANMLGPMGQNLNCLLFKAKTKDGGWLADPLSEGSFTAVVAGEEFKYRLPLGSLLPPKFDPDTHEKFPGNYRYSPFTGSALTGEASADPAPAPSGVRAAEPAK